MSHKQAETSPFTGFGSISIPKSENEAGIYILAIFRDGSLTAAAHATERGAMEAAVEYFESERDEDEASGALEDQFARIQQIVSDDGGVMEIISSPVYGG